MRTGVGYSAALVAKENTALIVIISARKSRKVSENCQTLSHSAKNAGMTAISVEIMNSAASVNTKMRVPQTLKFAFAFFFAAFSAEISVLANVVFTPNQYV